MARPISRIFLASVSNIIVPPGVTYARAQLYGGGGAGGHGTTGNVGTANRYACGGGGGGGSIELVREFAVTPGMSLDVGVGAGGINTQILIDGFTQSGEDSFVKISGGADKARAVGACGGYATDGTHAVSGSTFFMTPGGGPGGPHPIALFMLAQLTNFYQALTAGSPNSAYPVMNFGPGWGGAGVTFNCYGSNINTGFAGSKSLEGFAGGLGALRGADGGNNNAGGGGGGGAAGPGGVGGAGGAGGASTAVTFGAAGGAGGSGAANTGAGGGGGGASGGGTLSSGARGAGGDGGSGRVVLTWFR